MVRPALLPGATGVLAWQSGGGASVAHISSTAKGCTVTVSRGPQRAMVAGSGMAIGAALGMIFGLMLSADLALMVGVGVVAGLLIGAVVDLNRSRA